MRENGSETMAVGKLVTERTLIVLVFQWQTGHCSLPLMLCSHPGSSEVCTGTGSCGDLQTPVCYVRVC